MTLPLLARVQPIAGESLLSLITRSAAANVFTELPAFLAHAGVTGHPAFVPFTALERASALATLIGVDSDAVQARLHPPHADQSPKGAIVWAGTRVRRRSIEAKRRRVSPLSLAQSPHHRLVWTHRALSFCPESFQLLVDTCGECGGALRWTRTWGPERCEHCRRSLAGHASPTVPQQLHASLAAACALIDPDTAVRDQALARLPSTFAGCEPGDVFHVLSEVGAAWRRPEEGRASDTARALMDGSFVFAPEDLAQGYDLIADWPNGFGALVDRIRPHHPARRSEERPAACELGVLGRHLLAGPPTPTRQLLTEAVDQYGADRTGWLQARSLEAHEHQRKLERGVALMEASRLFAVSPKVLRRLVPDGGCCLGVGVGRGASVRFDKARLTVAVRAYKGALTYRQAAAALGVPQCFLPAFLGRGLLDRERSRDGRRLLGEECVQRRSLERLHERLAAEPVRSGGRSGTLAGFLRRRYAPSTWVEALQLTLTRPDVLYGYDADSKAPLLERLLVDWRVLQEQLPAEPSAPPADAGLTAVDAGRLLGLSGAHLPEIIEAGLLRADHDGPEWVLKLHDLLAFHREYIVSTEYYQRHGLAHGDRWLGPFNAFDFEIETWHFHIWRRVDVERFYAWPYPEMS